jgi:hypothetical protein
MSVDVEQLLSNMANRRRGWPQQLVDLVLQAPERLTDLIVRSASVLTTWSLDKVDRHWRSCLKSHFRRSLTPPWRVCVQTATRTMAKRLAS